MKCQVIYAKKFLILGIYLRASKLWRW